MFNRFNRTAATLAVAATLAAGLSLAACDLPGDTLPPDALAWRNAGTGSGPYGGTLGSPMPDAASPAEHFAKGGAPYPGLCGRDVTKPEEACTPKELADAGYTTEAKRMRELAAKPSVGVLCGNGCRHLTADGK